MRGTRWLLLVALAAILGGIGLTYRAQKRVLREQSPAQPAPLGVDLNSSSELWHWAETDTKTGRVTAEMWAKDAREMKDTGRVDLREVTLHLPSKKGDTYNLVKSASGSFFKNDHRLYADGEVEITLDVPKEGQAKHTLISIQSSGIAFDSATGQADTERPASFVFEHGDGSSTGAFYDPETHELRLKNDAKMHWQPPGPNAKPMLIEGASIEYHQAAAEILLKPWGRLTRDHTVVEGENPVVHLQEDAEGHKRIQKIEAGKAHGTDDYPNRKLAYSADQISVDFDDDGVARKITAQTNARLVSTSDSSETSVTANHVEMNFDTENGESVLTSSTATGNGVLSSRPLPGPGRQPSETHVLRSEQLDMKMRAGGRELESVVTHGPGALEFLPNLPAQHHRTLDGKDMFIAYGPQNRVQSFRAADARTRTDPTADERKRNRTVSVTSSRELEAQFDPKTSHLANMEQRGDFTYDEGDRHARAARATLDSDKDVIVLETGARFWDSTGSTSAPHIRMDQRTGDFTAEGGVTSSRMPDKDQKKNSEMLSGDEPLQAQARKMDSSNHNRVLHYEGAVTMWQGANRIQADVVDVNREKRNLTADRNVVTSLWEEPKDDSGQQTKKPAATPVLTVVRAPHMVYTDENRLADYTGGAALERVGLVVKAQRIRAFLAEQGADSRLEKAFADGAVHIVMTSKDGVRAGTADHSEYFTGEQKVILREAQPKLVERKKDTHGKMKENTTEGLELTYFADDDRLLVNGTAARPGQSRVQRK